MTSGRSDKELSDSARVLLAEMQKRGKLSNTEMAKALGWSRSKLYRVQTELIDGGMAFRVIAGLEGKMKDKNATHDVNPAKELAAHFMKKRFGGIKQSSGMWSRATREAKDALKNGNSLQELKDCIDWLLTQSWWKDHDWWPGAAAASGLAKYRLYKSKQQRMPGADESLMVSSDDR